MTACEQLADALDVGAVAVVGAEAPGQSVVHSSGPHLPFGPIRSSFSAPHTEPIAARVVAVGSVSVFVVVVDSTGATVVVAAVETSAGEAAAVGVVTCGFGVCVVTVTVRVWLPHPTTASAAMIATTVRPITSNNGQLAAQLSAA